MARSVWRRRAGGYLRCDGEWFLYRGAPMATGGTNAWLLYRRVSEDRVGREGLTTFDTSTGFVLWLLTDDGYVDAAPSDFVGDLYAHDLDAGSLAEARDTVAVVEARERAASVA